MFIHKVVICMSGVNVFLLKIVSFVTFLVRKIIHKLRFLSTKDTNTNLGKTRKRRTIPTEVGIQRNIRPAGTPYEDENTSCSVITTHTIKGVIATHTYNLLRTIRADKLVRSVSLGLDIATRTNRQHSLLRH